MSSVTAWEANVRSDGSVVAWDPLDLPYQSCVTGYNVSLNNEGIDYNTTTTTTSISLSPTSVSYCQTHTVTVIPLTLTGTLPTSQTSNITVIDPGTL